MMFETGQTITTPSGRTTAPFPKVDTTTERKTQNTVRRAHDWLVSEARCEVKATRKDHMNVHFDNETFPYPPATLDMASMVLGL